MHPPSGPLKSSLPLVQSPLHFQIKTRNGMVAPCGVTYSGGLR